MSDAEQAITAYQVATERLIAAMDRLTAAIAQGTGLGEIAADHPAVVDLKEQLHRLTLLTTAVGAKIGALGDPEFQSLVDRPSVERADRNTPSEVPGDDDDDAARV